MSLFRHGAGRPRPRKACCLSSTGGTLHYTYLLKDIDGVNAELRVGIDCCKKAAQAPIGLYAERIQVELQRICRKCTRIEV
jgi:hypothetical protein